MVLISKAMGWTCLYCDTFAPSDGCSTRHPDFHFGLLHAEVKPLHVIFS